MRVPATPLRCGTGAQADWLQSCSAARTATRALLTLNHQTLELPLLCVARAPPPAGGGSVLSYMLKKATRARSLGAAVHCGFYQKDVDLLAELQWIPQVRCAGLALDLISGSSKVGIRYEGWVWLGLRIKGLNQAKPGSVWAWRRGVIRCCHVHYDSCHKDVGPAGCKLRAHCATLCSQHLAPPDGRPPPPAPTQGVRGVAAGRHVPGRHAALPPAAAGRHPHPPHPVPDGPDGGRGAARRWAMRESCALPARRQAWQVIGRRRGVARRWAMSGEGGQ